MKDIVYKDNNLIIPSIKWLGIHSTDLQYIQNDTLYSNFTKRDHALIDNFLKMDYIQQDDLFIYNEIKYMKQFQKVELQALNSYHGIEFFISIFTK